MPTYQYACTQCDERLEAVQSFTDAPLTECPVCGGALRKVYSSVGVVFKGSGFYRNDSRGAAKGEGGGEAGGADKGSDKGSDGKAAPAGDKPAADKGAGDKGGKGGDKGSGSKTPAPAAASSSSSAPTAKAS